MLKQVNRKGFNVIVPDVEMHELGEHFHVGGCHRFQARIVDVQMVSIRKKEAQVVRKVIADLILDNKNVDIPTRLSSFVNSFDLRDTDAPRGYLKISR